MRRKQIKVEIAEMKGIQASGKSGLDWTVEWVWLVIVGFSQTDRGVVGRTKEERRRDPTWHADGCICMYGMVLLPDLDYSL